MAVVLTDRDKQDGWRVVTIDRFYTSVPLLIQLLSMKLYGVGTIMTNRVGYCKDVVNKSKTRGTAVRGSFKLARAVDIPCMAALSWIDNKPVHFLSTGAACSQSTVNRRTAAGTIDEITCPKVVTDYHQLMGGVDRHDQLRLQRYSLQTCVRFRKYYKSLFLGLVDLAIVNAYVTHVACAKRVGSPSMKRADFMTQLQTELTVASYLEFANTPDQITPTRRPRGSHSIGQNETFRGEGKDRKRRRNACKVCSIKFRRPKKKSNETSYFCIECSEDNKKMFLCTVIRAAQGNTKTCFDIWHQDWKCKVPATAESTIQLRPTTGKRKRRRTLRMNANEAHSSNYEQADSEDEEQKGEE
jgi:hypothetical protein